MGVSLKPAASSARRMTPTWPSIMPDGALSSVSRTRARSAALERRRRRRVVGKVMAGILLYSAQIRPAIKGFRDGLYPGFCPPLAEMEDHFSMRRPGGRPGLAPGHARAA